MFISCLFSLTPCFITSSQRCDCLLFACSEPRKISTHTGVLLMGILNKQSTDRRFLDFIDQTTNRLIEKTNKEINWQWNLLLLAALRCFGPILWNKWWWSITTTSRFKSRRFLRFMFGYCMFVSVEFYCGLCDASGAISQLVWRGHL